MPVALLGQNTPSGRRACQAKETRLTEEPRKPFRRRVNVKSTTKGQHTWDMTIEGEGYSRQEILDEVDLMHAELTARYDPDAVERAETSSVIANWQATVEENTGKSQLCISGGHDNCLDPSCHCICHDTTNSEATVTDAALPDPPCTVCGQPANEKHDESKHPSEGRLS